MKSFWNFLVKFFKAEYNLGKATKYDNPPNFSFGGKTYFRPLPPSREHTDKVYTIEELKELINQQKETID